MNPERRATCVATGPSVNPGPAFVLGEANALSRPEAVAQLDGKDVHDGFGQGLRKQIVEIGGQAVAGFLVPT